MAEDVVSWKLRPRCERGKKHQEETSLDRKEKKRNAARAWREKLKENPEKYKEHRMYESLRNQVYRQNLSEEKKAAQREKARLRQKKYREKKKVEGIPNPAGSGSGKKTRLGKELQRKKWREAKQLQRLNYTAQKQRRVNERRRQLYAEKKAKQQKTSTKSTPDTVSEFNTKAAKRKAISRCLRVFPKNSDKFAEVLSNIVQKCSPRKRQKLQVLTKEEHSALASTSSSIREKLKELRRRRAEKDNRLRRVIHAALLAKGRISRAVLKEYGLSKKLSKLSPTQLENKQRKSRCDSVPENQVREIQEFYQSGESSRELPIQRLVSAKKPTEPKKALEASLIQSYRNFQMKHPENKISYSKFVSLRPSNVLPMTKQKHYQCLCEYCVNIDFKVKSLGRFCASKGKSPVAVDRYEASRLTICPKDGPTPKKDCIDRNCALCGVDNLDEKTRDLLPYLDAVITWKKWEMVEQPNTKKKFMTLVTKSGTVRELIEELKESLGLFSKHLFNAKWQTEKFEGLKKDIPQKWIMFCMDFGENYSCHQQDEAQGAHWHQEQVTIHPIVAYFKCPEEGCQEVAHISLVFVSEDLKHDYHAVQHFVLKANQYLLQQGLAIEREIHFSDGAPTQYKSKANFVDLSMAEEDMGFPVEKHFFGSRHGKGPCDGEVGVVKRSASLAIRRGNVIGNATDFYEYCKTNLSVPKSNEGETHIHARRQFFFVKQGDIKRDQERLKDVKAIPQTRQTHQYRGIQPYVVTSRERSCFCTVCTQVSEGQCSNESIVGKWKVHTLKIRRRQGHAQPFPTDNAQPDATDVVQPDATSDALPDATGVALPDSTGVALSDATGVALPDATGVALPDATGVALPVATGDALPDATGVALPVATGDVLPDATGDALPDAISDAQLDATGDARPVDIEYTVPVATGVALPDATGVALPDATGVVLPDATGVALPDGTGVALPDGTGVALPDATGDVLPVTDDDALLVASSDALPVYSGDGVMSVTADDVPGDISGLSIDPDTVMEELKGDAFNISLDGMMAALLTEERNYRSRTFLRGRCC